MSRPRMVFVGISDDVWAEFTSWYAYRELPTPPRSSDGVFVAMENGTIVAGCLIYSTEGPYAVVEFASTNPKAKLVERYRAMELGIQGIRIYGAMRMKKMMCFPRDRSMRLLLLKAGFLASDATVLLSPQWLA